MKLLLHDAAPTDTASLGKALAACLDVGDLVFVYGPLGAGKTTLVREAAAALGVEDPVTSPSFTLAQSYHGRITVNHLDLYRLERLDADDLAEFETYLYGDGITFVEWPELLEGQARPTVTIRLEHAGPDRRKIEVEGEITARLEAMLGDPGPGHRH